MALALDKRAGNTVLLPIRLGGTVVYGGLDALNTVVTLPKQSLEIISNTTSQIKDVFSNARNKGKRYNKLVNVPLSPFVATGTAVEGAIRSVVNPGWNAITHTRDVVGNTFINTGNSVKWIFSDKPVSDFKYEHLKTSDIGKKNYVSKRQWFSSDTKKEAKKEDKKPEEPKGPSEKEIALEKKVGELETKNKNLESIIEKLTKQQEETNKKLAELLSAKKEEGGKIIKGDFKKGSKDKIPGERPGKRVETKKLETDEDYEDENEKIAA